MGQGFGSEDGSRVREKRDSRSSLTRILWGTLLIPRAQRAWLSFGSIRTSLVPISLWAKATTDFTAVGARFLNERPCTYLWRCTVYSRVTTSWSADRVFPYVMMGEWCRAECNDRQKLSTLVFFLMPQCQNRNMSTRILEHLRP